MMTTLQRTHVMYETITGMDIHVAHVKDGAVGPWLLDQTTSCCALLKTQTNPTIVQVTLFTPFYSMFEKLYTMRSIF